MMKVTRIEEAIVKQILLASIIANVKRTVGRISILTLSPWKVCFCFNPCSSSLTLHPVCIISNNSSLVSGSLFHNPFPNLNPNPHPLLPSLDCLLLSLRGGKRGVGLVLSIVVVVTKLGAVSKCDFFILFCKLVVRGGFVSGEVPLYRGTMKVIQHHISPPIIRGKVTRIKKLILNKKLSRSSTNSHNSEKKMYGKQ